MVSMRRSVAFSKSIVIYIATLILFTGLFISFHYVANQVPQAFIVKKLARDFHYHNLSKHNYPFAAHGPHSIVSNIGQNQFTECEVLLSVLATPSEKLMDAVLPPRLLIKGKKSGCEALEETVKELGNQGQTDAIISPLRTRYWWGARAIYSYTLRFFNVYQTREMIRNLTSFAYLGLAVALFALSASMFWRVLPLLLFGTLFSGISYFSEVVLGVPYLWAITAPMMVAALHASAASRSLIYLAIFIAGMVSSYLWLLDGHILLLASWLILIGYFSTLRSPDLYQPLRESFGHVFVYVLGFMLSYLSGLLVKVAYVGFGPVFEAMSSAVVHRSSTLGPGDSALSLSIVMDRVWNVGYQWTGVFKHELLWKVVILGSLAAAITGITIGLFRVLKGEYRLGLTIAVCVMVALMVFARIFLLQNHSVIHAFFIGRYMFIPLAMSWVVLLISLSPGSQK